MKKGFTLVELLVVIAIISMLAMASTKMIGAARSAGHAARCQGNLKALWQGVQNYATEHDGNLPYAGSHEYYHAFDGRYYCHNGWVCWTPNGGVDTEYYWGRTKTPDQKIAAAPICGTGLKETRANQLRHRGIGGKKSGCDDDAALDAIRFSYFFDYVNQDLSIYCCPTFRAAMKDARRSYVMNQWFGARRNKRHIPARLHMLDGNVQASRLLVFTEMEMESAIKGGADNPGEDGKGKNPSGNLVQDSVFDATGSEAREFYGAIHRKSGKLYAHAIFLDGHIESLAAVDPAGKDSKYQETTSKKISSGNW